MQIRFRISATRSPENTRRASELMTEIGIGCTLATGRLFCEVSEFHEFAEKLLGRPIFTHEFASQGLWDSLRLAFERETTEEMRRVGV